MSATGIELGLDPAVGRVLDALEKGRRAWVAGQPGAGRSTVAQRIASVLRDKGRQVAVVDVLDREEEDAAIGVLYAIAAELPGTEGRSRCFRDWSTLAKGIAELEASAPEEFTAIVSLHSSWELRGGDVVDDWSESSARRCAELLAALSRSSVLNVVWITSRLARPETVGCEEVTASLPAPRNTPALLETADWGPYAPAAKAVLGQLGAHAGDPSPVALRLAVGVVALGGNAKRATAALREGSSAVGELASDLADRLGTAGFERCRSAVGRLLLARRSLPVDKLAELTGITSEHATLLRQCVGYPSTDAPGMVKVSSSVRRSSLARLAVAEDVETNQLALAEHFKSFDGAPRISATYGGRTTAWLEKEHHLAQTASDATVDLPCRELYWARGRFLSIRRQAYARAARVYRECAERFPDDAYSWHYLGFNLERAGEDRQGALRAYERAVELEPSNPWWNSRKISFLLGQGRIRSAKEAWRQALDNIDPDGDWVSTEHWLPEHLHNWVARGWLSAGYAAEAFDVVRAIPKAAFAASPRLERLRQSVLDAVEADALGESVYPAGYPVDQRWKEPSTALGGWGDRTLVRWFPGRVARADAHTVRVVYASRLEGGSYETNVTEIDAATWSQVGFGRPDQARGFVQLGVYDDGSRRVVPVDDRPTPPNVGLLPLAYFDRWRSRA